MKKQKMSIYRVILVVGIFSFSACGVKDEVPTATTAPPTATATAEISLEISEITPQDKDVSINEVITVIFSEPIDESTVNETNIIIMEGDQAIEGEIKVDGPTVTFTPLVPFEYLKTYVVTVSDTVSAISGNQLEDEFSWSFETGGPFTVVYFESPSLNQPSDTGSFLMDLDSDGDLDLIIARQLYPPAPSQVYAFRNDGAGNFTDSTADVFAGQKIMAETWRHWAIADFNGDGRNDLFVADHGFDPYTEEDVHTGGQSRIFIQNDLGQLVDETFERLPQMLAFTHNVAAGDVDNDGDVDVYMGNRAGHVHVGPRFYINDGNGYFSDEPERIPWRIASKESYADYASCILLDVDLDGDLDLFLGGKPAAEDQDITHDTLLLNDGTGIFDYAPPNSLPPRLEGMDEEVGIGTGDFNQDGWPDLVIASQIFVGDGPDRIFTGPQLHLLVNNGDGTFRDETPILNQDWASSIRPDRIGETQTIDWPVIVDYNNDGWPDIFTVNWNIEPVLFENNNGENFSIGERLGGYMLNPRGEFEQVEMSKLLEDYYSFPEIALIGDLDGDGNLDYVIIYDGWTKQVVLLRN